MIELTEIRKHFPLSADPSRFGLEKAEEARAFHRTLEGYAPTPLVKLTGLAGVLGIAGMYVKDESRRFGLNAFKALGGSFAMQKLTERADLPRAFVTATDGNHGRGVAWAAKRLGCEAHVYLPRGTAAERLENIRALGARAEILDLSYDDTVRHAAAMAEKHGWCLIQDTAWPGYEEVPALIMQGYTTMGLEAVEQLGDVKPTHIFLQAGVGAMAGAMTAFFADYYGSERPKIIVVEPEGADCIFRTAEADDGTLHFCGEDMSTIMAGLCCGKPCTLGWEQLRDYADFALACPDSIAANGMRILASPRPGDSPIVSGESGAVTVGAVEALKRLRPDLCDVLGLDFNSVVLCISTEGDTDRENYRNVVWYGKYPDQII